MKTSSLQISEAFSPMVNEDDWGNFAFAQLKMQPNFVVKQAPFGRG